LEFLVQQFTLGEAARRHRPKRAHSGRRRDDLPPSLPHGPGGHRLEAAERALPVGTIAGLAEDQEPGQPDAGSGVVNFAARGTL
jgi:hypothetical protein